MSPWLTALPRSAILASNSCEDSRPPDMLTTTLSTSTPDMRSAASTARRIAPSAASRSTIAPAFTPRERWWPMPSTRQRWVRSGSAAESSIGVSRAIRLTIFEAPTSSTDRTADLRGGSCRMRGVRGLKVMAMRPSWVWPPRAPPPPLPTAARRPGRGRADRPKECRVRECATAAATSAASPSPRAARPPAA